MGQFRSVRSRLGTKLHRRNQQNDKNKKAKHAIKPIELQTRNNEQLTKQFIADGTADIKACFERAIDWAIKYIPAECSTERDA